MIVFCFESTSYFFRKSGWIFLAALLLWTTPGCSSYPFRGVPDQALLGRYDPDRLSYFEPNKEISFNPTLSEERESYSIWTLSLQPEVRLPQEEGALQIHYYRPMEAKGPFPAIVLLPITSGDYFTENLGRYFVKKGFAVLRFPSRNELGVLSAEGDPLIRFRDVIKNDVVNVRQGVSWLKMQEEVDPSRIGIMGISLGAILASLVLSIEPDLQGAVLFLGGGNLPEILKTSQEDPIVAFRERKVQGKSGEQAERSLEKFFLQARSVLRKVDPLAYSSLMPPDRILMINGYFDGVIRRAYTKQLWAHLGKPNLIYLPTGHYGSILYFPYARYKAYQHFRSVLKKRSTRGIEGESEG